MQYDGRHICGSNQAPTKQPRATAGEEGPPFFAHGVHSFERNYDHDNAQWGPCCYCGKLVVAKPIPGSGVYTCWLLFELTIQEEP